MEEMKLPKHIGIIMDGNGRWATERGLSRSKGHEAGADNLKSLSKYIFNKGIKYLSVYAFSTENFKRDIKEVTFLMNLFIKMFKEYKKEYAKENIKVIFSGKRENLRKDVLKSMDDLEEITKNNTGAILNICLNYGGQDEIVDATKKIVEEVINGKLTIEDINKDVLENNLYNILPPLDLVIRTSGEYRTSNFMLWQSSYAEYYFTDTYFPDFNDKEFDKALLAYQGRNRRFGGVKDVTKNN